MFSQLWVEVDPSSLLSLLTPSLMDVSIHYASIGGCFLLLLVAAGLLAASLSSYTIFLYYMWTKPGSSSRLLNVLLANMVAFSMWENIRIFAQVG